MKGALTFHRGRLTAFTVFMIWLLLGAGVQAIVPNRYSVAYSDASLLQFILATGFSTLSFAKPVAELPFWRQGANILAALAALGILQFTLQFGGLSLFTFTTFLPDRLLFETNYNVVIPVGIGSLNKANGFFLLEPSIFSQAMAMGLIIEALSCRRVTHISLFIAALILSFSGTGWIIIASFILSIALTRGARGIALGLGGVMALAIIALGVVFLAPNVAAVFANRLDEVNQVGTSGYLRFVTPFKLLHTVYSSNSLAWLTGIGAGVAERIDLPFFFGANTPIKIMVEYGIPALLIYVALILTAKRSPLQRLMVLPSLTLLFLTGGYQQFAPVLFPVFLLICIARFEPAPEVV